MSSVLVTSTTSGHTSFLSTSTPLSQPITHIFPAVEKTGPVEKDETELEVLRAHPRSSGPRDGCPCAVALAGKERELEVWVAEKSNDTDDKLCWKQIFIAKNVKNDRNNLRVPVWITDIQFLPDNESGSFRILAVTKYSGVSEG